jgi:hypothetical protein
MAAAQGIEGAAYGVGALISDEALGEADVTAENLLTYAGLGAATGAGMGAVFGVGGELARKAAHGITHATAGAVDRMYQATTGEATGGKLVEMWRSATRGLAKAHGLVGEGEPAAVEAGLQSAKVRAAMQPLSEADTLAYAGRIAEHVDRQYQISERVMPLATGDLKRQQVARVVATGNEGAVVARSQKVIDDVKAVLGAAAEDPLSTPETDRLIKRGLEYVQQVEAQVTGIDTVIDPVTGAAMRVRKMGWSANNTDAFIGLDRLKRFFGQKEFSQAGLAWPSGLKAQAATQYRNAYEGLLMPYLEDASIWGADAAALQREVNDAWQRWLQNQAEFRSKFMSPSVVEDRIMGRSFARAAFDTDKDKIAGFLKRVGFGKSGGTRERALFEQQIGATKKLTDAIAKHYDDVPPDVLAAVNEADAAYPGLKSLLDDIDTRVAGSNALRQMSGGDSVTATALGYAIAGGPGALAAQAIARPDRIIRTLAAVDRMANQVRGRVTAGVDAFINRSAGAARGAAERLRPAAGVVSGRTGRREDFNEKALRITNDAADPEGLARRTTGALSSLHQDAPRVTQAMVIKDMQRRAYLYNELPKATQLPSLFDKPGKSPDITDFAMDAWLDKYEVSFEPARAIDHLVAGTLSPAHVDALRTTAPRLYESMKTELMTRVPGSGLAYQDRLRLGMLFGMNLDPTTDPAFVAAMKPAPPPKPTHESKGIRKDQQPLEERTASASTALAKA